MKRTRADLALARYVGEQTRAARNAKQWNQEELASRAGVDRKTISTLENGGNPELLTIGRVARALEKGCAYFFPAEP